MNTPIWPSTILDVDDVREWITSMLPGHPEVSGPTTIYTAHEWSITARFSVHRGRQHSYVILKVCPLTLYRTAPLVYDLLAQYHPHNVPEIIAWTRRRAQSWMLFQPFDGPSVWATKRPELLLEVAKTLAHIQKATAAAPSRERDAVPRTSVKQIPEMLETITNNIRTTYAQAWSANEGALAEQFHVPSDPVRHITMFQDQVAAWADELSACDWPDTLDHVDLHTNNIAVRPDGHVVLYDWDEAVLSCPYFSLDRLLDDAHKLDVYLTPKLVDASHWSDTTPTELAVRQVYLDTVDWHTRPQRERAFDLAMCLAPIKTTYEVNEFAEATGWQGMEYVTAWHIGRVLQRWEAMAR